VDRIDLWQLHRVDPQVPAAEQFDAIAQMRKEGLIRYVGLSEVSVEQIQQAQKHFPVATVQNMYNLFDRQSEQALDFCEKNGIGFIPWYPLGAGKLAGPESALAKVAARLKVTPAQVALAWVLKRSKVMLPIPGTSKVHHLEENVATASLQLTDEDFVALDKQGRAKA
jgi:pyridoxine 4-dehydrogenase